MVQTEIKTMAMLTEPLEPFEETLVQWHVYTERFELFVMANDMAEKKKVPIFLSVVGPKTYSLPCSLLHPVKPETKSYSDIVEILGSHFPPKPLVIAERYRFHKSDQKEDETVVQFVATLRKLAEHCEFKEMLNDALRDRLVCGLYSEAVWKRLLTEAQLTLQKAVDIAVSMELATKEAQSIGASPRVHKVSQEPTHKTVGSQECNRCGKPGHQASECWCKDRVCRHCGKKGHIECACKQKKKRSGLADQKGNPAYPRSKPRMTKVTPHRKRKCRCTFCLWQWAHMNTGEPRCWTANLYAWNWTPVQLSHWSPRLCIKKSYSIFCLRQQKLF
uniref:CCHC-type domain-containing protein n=1 Tax=Chrysemys picta bellii TaxID=8478 RepID=A0A8C3IEG0_CHRPI